MLIVSIPPRDVRQLILPNGEVIDIHNTNGNKTIELALNIPNDVKFVKPANKEVNNG